MKPHSVVFVSLISLALILSGCTKSHPAAAKNDTKNTAPTALPQIIWQPLPTEGWEGGTAEKSGWDLIIAKAGKAKCTRSADDKGNVTYKYSLPDGDRLEVVISDKGEKVQLSQIGQEKVVRETPLHEVTQYDVYTSKNVVDLIVLNLLRYNMPFEDLKAILGPGGQDVGSAFSIWEWQIGMGTLDIHLSNKERGEERESIYTIEQRGFNWDIGAYEK